MTKQDSPGVHVPPPFIYAAAFAMGFGVHSFVPSWSLPEIIEIPSLIVSGVGFAIIFWSIGLFWKQKTTILPNKSATEFVIEGPYKFTRNPMYFGMLVAYVGVSILTGLLWALIFLPLAIYIIVRSVITREEAYLQRRFGTSYQDYCKRVRRWI